MIKYFETLTAIDRLNAFSDFSLPHAPSFHHYFQSLSLQHRFLSHSHARLFQLSHSALVIHFDVIFFVFYTVRKKKTNKKPEHNNDANRQDKRVNCREFFIAYMCICNCYNIFIQLCTQTHTHTHFYYLSPTITGNIIFARLNGLFHAH